MMARTEVKQLLLQVLVNETPGHIVAGHGFGRALKGEELSVARTVPHQRPLLTLSCRPRTPAFGNTKFGCSVKNWTNPDCARF